VLHIDIHHREVSILLVIMIGLAPPSLSAQDTRAVTEPSFPPSCQVIPAYFSTGTSIMTTPITITFGT